MKGEMVKMDKEIQDQEVTEQKVQEEATEQSTQEVNVDDIVKDYEDKIKALQGEIEGYKEIEKASIDNSIKLELVKSGLSEDYFDLVADADVEVAKTKISKLVELQKQNVIENAYKPTDHKVESEYEKAEASGDTKGMIKSKIAGLFQ